MAGVAKKGALQIKCYEIKKFISTTNIYKVDCMNGKKILFLALNTVFTCSYCNENIDQKFQIERPDMTYTFEKQSEKFFIGLELRTNNEECSSAMPAHKERFFNENIYALIPNKINGSIVALYTDYAGDYTQPYSWILGCEVSSLDEVPKGLVGKIIPESNYAVFTTKGTFPQGLITAWQAVWRSNLSRSYTSDFELYPSDFDPDKNPEVKVYIAVETVEKDLQSVIQGRLDTFRSTTLCSPLPQADFKETDFNSYYAWGIDYAIGNGVIEKNSDRIPSEEEINQTIQYFSDKKLPFMWWTSAKILESKGFQFGGILTGIALDLSEGIPPKPQMPANLKIKIAESEGDMNSFAELTANIYGLNSKAQEEWQELNTAIQKRAEQIYFLAYLDNLPVGAVALSVSPTSAGIWSLATLPESRTLGIGSTLVHAAMVEAKKREHAKIIAILMPKGMAWGLFTKLGFKEVCEFPFYVYGASPEELEK